MGAIGVVIRESYSVIRTEPYYLRFLAGVASTLEHSPVELIVKLMEQGLDDDFFLSIVIAILAWFLLFKTKWGFNLQIAGANKHAAKYAGLNVKVWMVLGMTLSGALAGLCSAVQCSWGCSPSPPPTRAL